MPEISVVIITFNEERNIGRCLDSVRDFADEILVVDSFSTDNTEAICTEKGARFIRNAWPGYVGQKNHGNSLARHSLIFSIDADEAVSEELKKSILEVKQDPRHDAWEMSRLTNYCGHWVRHGGWYPDMKVRLFDRGKCRWTGLRIHETVGMDPGTRVGRLKGDLLHYSYYSIEGHMEQANKFSGIAAAELFERNKKASWLKILVSPPVKFLRDFIFHLGFLDGYSGFVIARISAHATFLKYAKLKELHSGNKPSP